MSRYVILEHDYPSLHWDFMLEENDHLATWRLSSPPTYALLCLEAEKIGNHRLFYLEHEGAVSGGRGNVRRWDSGTFTTVSLTESEWTVRLMGRRWAGTVEMRKVTLTWQIRFEEKEKQTL